MQIEKKSSELCSETTECAICLQECVHAVRLPCNHIFCYLCVKGAANQSNRCAVCRQNIPNNYFENPILIEDIDCKDVAVFDDEFQWLYEGRNGWWLYDIRTGQDIETAFKSDQSKCELLIAGFLYVIDFDRMIQYRRNEPNRIRRIRRDRPDISSTKGVAGLRTDFIDVFHNQLQQPSDSSTVNEPEESTQSNSSQTQEDNESPQIQGDHQSSQTNTSGDQRQQQIETFDAEVVINNTIVSDSLQNGSNSGHIDLDQLLANSLTLRDTRETYL